MDNRQDEPVPGSNAGEANGPPLGYPTAEEMTNMASSSTSSPFWGTFDDMSLLQSGLYRRRSYNDLGEDHYRFQVLVGRSIDPRLLALLEFFRELYFRKRELFKKVFPGLPGELVELSRKIGGVVDQVTDASTRGPTLQRSLSIGSPRAPSNVIVESPASFELFKVRVRHDVVLDVGVQQGGDQGGQGTDQGGQADDNTTSAGGSK